MQQQIEEHITDWLQKIRLLSANNIFCKDLNTTVLWMFQDVHLWASIEQYMHSKIEIPTQLTWDDFFLLLFEYMEQSEENPIFSGRDHSAKGAYDPISYGNIPYYLFSIDGKKIIRMPTVTRKNKNTGETTIIYEFYSYLKTLKKDNLSHLYVNLLNGFGHSSDNGKKQEVLHKLENDPNISCYVATVDKNSDFYWQKDLDQNLKKATYFKALFYKNLFDIRYYQWPVACDQKQWQQFCFSLLNNVHKTLFSDKAILTIAERQNFIEIVNLELIKQIIYSFDVTTANISCMYTMDRAATLLAHLYIDYHLINKTTIPPKEALRLIWLICEQPLLFHNRPAHDYRLNRLLKATRTVKQKNSRA